MPPEPPPKTTDTTSPPSWMAPVMPVVPDHELVRRIGGGSYGDVWLARTTVGTWRAVKVVFRDRFTDARPYEREFNGIQKFEPLSRGNEAFIDILQIGRNDAEGYFYYVMELADDAAGPQVESLELRVEGEAKRPDKLSTLNFQPSTYVPKTLSKVLLQRGRLPLAECLELGLTLNLGLAQLHRAGLIHRDIKPSNIIFVGGVPKLADIGLVIELAEARSFVGTEGFIPPEGPNSPQADLYSLGKVLYEAGMGKDRKDFPEPYTQIAEAPDAAALLEFNAILLKACAANRDERCQSAEEMNADLALLQSGGSVRRQRKPSGQLRFVQRAGALVTALAAVIALGWWWQAKQTRLVRELAAQKSQLAEEKTRLAEENRQRLVRLDIANGVHLLDEGDPAGALLWFADSLSLVTNNPAEESIQRIRLRQTMDHAPRLANVFPHPANVQCAVFSPDEKQIATACEDGLVRIWDATRNETPLVEFRQPEAPRSLHYTRDGRRLLVVTAPTSLWYAASLCLAVLDAVTGHAVFPAFTNITAWAASADDHWLAVAETNYVIQLCDLTSGQLAATFPGHQGFVNEINFSPDYRKLVTASFDRTTRVWEVPAGKPAGHTLRLSSPVFRAVFSPDGRKLATATLGPGERGELQIWDVATGLAIGQPTEVRDGIFVLGFDRRGRRLLAGDQQYALQVRDASTGEAQPSLKLLSYACSFAASPTDDRIAVGADNGHVSLWDAETGRRAGPPLFHSARVESVQFDQTGRRLLTASGDGTVKLWELTPPQPARTLRLDGEWPKYDPGSIRASFGREAGPMQIPLMDGAVRLIDRDSLRELHRLSPQSNASPSYNCESSSNGRHWQLSGGGVMFLFSENADGTIRRIELSPSGGAFGGNFSPDSTRLLTLGNDRTIRVWRTSDGSLERSVRIPEPFTDSVVASLDLRLVLLGQPDGVHQWFDLTSKIPVGSQFRLPSLWSARLDPSGERIAVAGRDQTVRVWKVGTGEPASPVFKHPGTSIYLDWSADGRRLLTAGTSPDARIWDAATGEQLLSPLTLSSEPIRAARWGSDGRFIVARSDDQLVRVWDAATAEPVTPMLRQESYVRFAGLLPNGRLLIATDPNTVQAWDFAETRLAPDVLSDYARLISGRRLSPGGTLLPLKPDELAALRRSLATRAPELFQ